MVVAPKSKTSSYIFSKHVAAVQCYLDVRLPWRGFFFLLTGFEDFGLRGLVLGCFWDRKFSLQPNSLVGKTCSCPFDMGLGLASVATAHKSESLAHKDC